MKSFKDLCNIIENNLPANSQPTKPMSASGNQSAVLNKLKQATQKLNATSKNPQHDPNELRDEIKVVKDLQHQVDVNQTQDVIQTAAEVAKRVSLKK